MASLWLEMALAGIRLACVCYCKPMSTYMNWYIGDVSFRKIVQILGVLITTPYREIGQKTCLVWVSPRQKKTSICLPVLCHCHCCNIYRRRKHCLARTQKLIDWNHIIIKAIFCYHLAHEISRKTLTTPLSSNYNIISLHVLLDFNAIFGTWSPRALGERYQRRHLRRLSSSSRWFVSSDKPA